MQRSPIWVLPAVFFITLLSGCFPRECQEHANCARTCDCLDSATQTNTACAMTFLCEVQERQCESAYEMECNELCSTYAAKNLCGSKRCSLDEECMRTATCQISDAQGNTQEVSCTQQFACDESVGTCESAYILDDLSFCQVCLANATSQ